MGAIFIQFITGIWYKHRTGFAHTLRLFASREKAGQLEKAKCMGFPLSRITHRSSLFIRGRHQLARQLGSVLVVPELRCALVRPVGLVHEELLPGQDSLLQ